jgi:transglutaminase-like putative cysteine protease
VLLIVLLLWRWVLWRQRAPQPSRLMMGLAVALVLAVGAALVSRASDNVGRDLSVALLGAFVVLKLLECRALNEATLVTQLCFFLLLSLYLFDQPFWLALYSTAIGGWLLRNWLYLHHPQARGELAVWPLLARLALAGLPLALLLFVLFPRLDHPLWRLPQAGAQTTTGMGDTMRPGSVSELIRSDEIALRVAFDRGPLAPDTLYWRGLVLWDFDGQAWHTAAAHRAPAQPAPAVWDGQSDPVGDAVDYVVTLEPTQRQWLFVLDRGEAIAPQADAVMSGDGEFLVREPIDQRLLYRARSRVAAPAQTLSPRERQLALSLPDGNPRARALAAQWTDRYEAPMQRVQAALRLFASAPFVYTLSPPALVGQQIDGFLFDTRRGFCEHYAGSFVFLMRAAGVPARVVVGYQGGEYNPVGRHYIVRQSDAHAWAEVWLDGRGWVRVDPTSAVAPSRVERGIDGALSASEIEALHGTRATGWLRDLRWGFDGMVYAWHRWVLQYDHVQQAQLVRQLPLGATLPQLLALGIATLALLGLVPMWLRRKPVDPVQALFARFCLKLARRGCERAPGEGPLDFAARASRLHPAAALPIDLFTARYIALRYGPLDPDQRAGHVDALRAALRQVGDSLPRR